MIKRILPLALGLLFLFSFVGIEKVTQAVTASYTSTMRFINSGGFVIDGGSASATTASYNATAQIVNSSGTVIDPGSASTTTASPNITLRVVDSTGHVIDAFSTPAPTASPVPTPVATGTATTLTNGTSITSSSTTNGSILALILDTSGGTTFTNAVVPLFRASTDQTWTAGHKGNVYIAPVGTTLPGASISGFPATSVACEFAVAHATGFLDATPTIETPATSTTPTCPSITTTTANAEVICACLWNPASGTVTFTQPAGMTLESNLSGVSGVNIGCAIADKVFATAGATGALAGTLNTSSLHQCFTIAIEQR